MSVKVTIPISVGEAGELLLSDGRPVGSVLKSHSKIAVRCDLSSISDAKLRNFFATHKLSFEVAGPDEVLMMGLQPEMMTVAAASSLLPCSDLDIVTAFVFVEVKLHEPLRINWEKGRLPRLASCKCSALSVSADSLNHIYTRLSEKFETKRKAHTANVFDRVWCKKENGWIRLSDIRE